MNYMDLKSALERIQTLEMEIAECTRTKTILYESEEKFRALVESTGEWIWEVDQNGIYTYVSPQVEALLGYRPKEVLGKSPFDFMPPEEVQRVIDVFVELLDKRAPLLALRNTNLCKDGSLKILETSGVPFFDEKGEFAGYRGIDRDITNRVQAEEALRESEEKFHSITASAQDAILIMDDKGKIAYWNEAAEKIFGYSEKEVTGWPLHELLAPERFLEAHHKAFEHFKMTGEGAAVGKTVELAALKKDGTEFPIELSLSATVKNGRWSAIGMIRDISERKAMEKELKDKDEMMIAQAKQAAMGDMIAMIAHQWRQPLAVIGMDVNNLLVSIALEEEITTEYLLNLAEALNKQVAQLSETIENFRNFFKPNQSEEETTVDDILTSTLSIIGTSLENHNIRLIIQGNTHSSLFINKSSLIQVLLNILGNAKDVLLANKVAEGIITVTVSETKEATTISICDNAGGIPESIMDKIGQPYFTTKQEFNGTGLGIYISRTIIEKHLHGTFTWHNESQGACFVITLKKSIG
jgi:two-component system, LuxR family, sensor kinase FixL